VKELGGRLDTVLQIIYLLFNEGYNASQGDNLIRVELCDEAIRLARLVADHPAGRHPRVYALLALMYLHAARFSTRLNSRGELCLLKDQDRSSWDRKLLQTGLYYLDASAEGDLISTYHLQAGIAACHCTAADFGSTDWPQILRLYDMLMEFDNSPIVALNRAVAFSRVHGPGQGLEEVVKLSKDVTIANYYLTHAVLGELYFETDDYRNAAEHFRTALSLTNLPAERLFLTRSVVKCERCAFDHDFEQP
jgi:RNA polymerase sigma-70 factor (ECF subfamily)